MIVKESFLIPYTRKKKSKSFFFGSVKVSNRTCKTDILLTHDGPKENFFLFVSLFEMRAYRKLLALEEGRGEQSTGESLC